MATASATGDAARRISAGPTVREMPSEERPRERLAAFGPRHLSNTELIAILLRTGSAGENVISQSSRLLSRFDGLRGLGKATYAELCAERGLSEAKTCQILAALELGRRFVSLAPEERATINSPEDVVNLLSAEMSAAGAGAPARPAAQHPQRGHGRRGNLHRQREQLGRPSL